MKSTYFPILAAVLTTLLLSHTARADWQGDLHIKTPPHGPNGKVLDMAGKIFGKAAAMRMDLDGPIGKLSIISDWKQHKVWNLMHAQKIAMETNMDRVGVEIPSCTNSNIETCLTTEGFKKTGTEAVNGHPCAIYEKDRSMGTTTNHIKLWHPTDLKEVPLLRSVSLDAHGGSAQVDFTNVKVVSSLSAALFSPPQDYRQQSGYTPRPPGVGRPGMPPGAIPANGKMTPEQIQKLREQMMKQVAHPSGQ